MQIFISWSGEGTASQITAIGVAAWLEGIFQTSLTAFVSSEDIEKGKRWFSEISGSLEKTDFGIVCVTPFNRVAPWLMFEAGAIAKKVLDANVVPLLIGMPPEELSGPLAQFQAMELNKDQLRSLVETINSKLPEDRRLKPDLLKVTFDKWSNDIDAVIKKADGLITTQKGKQGQPAAREVRDIVEETLNLVRSMARLQHNSPVFSISNASPGFGAVPPGGGFTISDVSGGDVITGAARRQALVDALRASPPTGMVNLGDLLRSKLDKGKEKK